ncbi:MAG: dioxygenase [Burkholderiales bacterium]|nr:dioxygenase [Burkholderiales bacterium]
MSLPTLFVSHGSPMLAKDPGATGAAWQRMAAELPKPRAIVIASAHWMTQYPVVSTATAPVTIHDFYGFPESLYRLGYEAHGAPAVAEQVAARIHAAGMRVGVDPARGLDHGAWVPLRSMYPQADVPVFQLAIQPRETPGHHYQVGRALAGLGEEGVLVLASGSMTHNLRDLQPNLADGTAGNDYVTAFAEWMHEKLLGRDIGALLDYRRRAPHAQCAHPTDEHLLPLYVALGAAGDNVDALRWHQDITAGGLSMDAYRFDRTQSLH